MIRLSNIFKSAKPSVDHILKDIETQIEYQRGNLKEKYPSDFTEEEKQIIDAVQPYTMTSCERLVSLSRAIDYLEQNQIIGDIVECGVWRGGSMMVAAKKLVKFDNTERKLYLFDTYEGMPAPGGNDVSFNSLKASDVYDTLATQPNNEGWCYSSLDEVKFNVESTGINPASVVYVKGKVEQTLPLDAIEKIALLRLDTDWYESTKHELETLYHKLVVGGVLIIDDYGHWTGARKAVDEFFEKKNVKIFLSRIDYTGRLAIKIE